MRLPPEFLGFVFGSLERIALERIALERIALFNVRLVCKSFEQAANPLLFDQVYVSNTRADLKIANLTVLCFGRYIRTLVFRSQINLHGVRFGQLPNFGTFEIYLRSIEPPECFNQHLEHLDQIHRTAR